MSMIAMQTVFHSLKYLNYAFKYWINIKESYKATSLYTNKANTLVEIELDLPFLIFNLLAYNKLLLKK